MNPLAERTSRPQVYYLRSLASDAAVDVLAAGLRDARNTPLMRHELGYVLG